MSQVKTFGKVKTIPFGKLRSNGKGAGRREPAKDNSIKNISVVIPAFNEELGVRESILELRRTFESTKINAEIIIVDDGSKDKTAREAKAAGARVIQHRSNRGYGRGRDIPGKIPARNAGRA